MLNVSLSGSNIDEDARDSCRTGEYGQTGKFGKTGEHRESTDCREFSYFRQFSDCVEPSGGETGDDGESSLRSIWK